MFFFFLFSLFQSLRSNYPVQVTTDPQGIRGIYCLFTLVLVVLVVIVVCHFLSAYLINSADLSSGIENGDLLASLHTFHIIMFNRT